MRRRSADAISVRSRLAECSRSLSRSMTGLTAAAVSERYASATFCSTAPIRPTTAANASPKRSTGAARSWEPPRSERRERPRSVAFASARTRLLGRTSPPSGSRRSRPPGVRTHSVTSDRTSRPRRRLSCSSSATSGGSSSIRGLPTTSRKRTYRAADSGSAHASAIAAPAPRMSASSSSRAAPSSTIAVAAYQTDASPSPTSSSAYPAWMRCASARTDSSTGRISSVQPSRKYAWRRAKRPSGPRCAGRTEGSDRGGGTVPPGPVCVPASVMCELPPHLPEFPHEYNSPARSCIPPLHGSAPVRWRRRREAVRQEPFHVLEQLFGLVPAVEHTDAGGALAAGVCGDDHRDFRATRARRIRRSKRLSDGIRAVEDRDVHARLQHRLRESLRGRQLLDLEVAAAEQEPCEPEEAWVAARDEHAGAGLVVLVVERDRSLVRARVGGATRRPGDAVADLQAASPTLTRSEFDDLARAAARDGPPGSDLVLDPDHDLVGVEEDGVDREAHERGVDAPAGAENHTLALSQVLAPEQTAHASVRPVGDDHPFADDPAVLPAERQGRHRYTA